MPQVIQEPVLVRSGQGKNGKPYEIYNIVVEDGQEVQVFGPVKLGDEVSDIKYNETYNVTQGKVVRAGGNQELLALVKENNQILKRLIAALTTPDKPADTVVDPMDEPLNVEDFNL